MLDSRKEGKYLVFEFEDGKNVKYDLSNGQTIGKLGKPVKDVCSQLRGFSILEVVESFKDLNYRRFLLYVDGKINRSTDRRSCYQRRVSKITNLGTFLKKIEDYSKYEQIFSTGIKHIDGSGLKRSIKDIPKGLLKICREKDVVLSDTLIKTYIEMPNEINSLMDMDFNSISRMEILRVLIDASHRSSWQGAAHITLLAEEYNYNIRSLFSYLDNLITYEALEGLSNVISEFYDYVRMMSRISNKFEKYPKNFLTTHKIATRNYNRLKVEFEEDAFKRAIDKSMEYSYGGYVFIYPQTTQEIKDEAVQQNNCVASYIQNVIDRKCHILFMRKKDDKEKSLITIEVRGNKIVQAKGKFNRDCTQKEMVVIDKWNKARERKLNKKIKNNKDEVVAA